MSRCAYHIAAWAQALGGDRAEFRVLCTPQKETTYAHFSSLGLLPLCFVLTLPSLPQELLSMALHCTRLTGQMDQSNERCNWPEGGVGNGR